jgi:hypothetical protein
MIQGRNPDWVLKPFFAEYNDEAVWIDQLRPAFGQERFFFESASSESLQHDPENKEPFHRFHSDH